MDQRLEGLSQEHFPAVAGLAYEDFYDYGNDDRKTLSQVVCWYGKSETDVIGGGRKPNRFGLCDMHGNVWEWCADVYNEADGGEPGRTGHVIRGGAYDSTQLQCRSGWRTGCDGAKDNVGFRVILGEAVASEKGPGSSGPQK